MSLAGRMRVKIMITFAVYSDTVISVSLFADDEAKADKNLIHLAVRWLEPQPYRQKDGTLAPTTNVMGGATDWFILPHSFGAVVGKRLVEQKVAGLAGFDEEGFAKMVAWLVDMEDLHDAMCY